MTSVGLIDRKGLLDWTDSNSACGELLRLIRRLIFETGKGVVAPGFLAAEGPTSGVCAGAYVGALVRFSFWVALGVVGGEGRGRGGFRYRRTLLGRAVGAGWL